MVSGITSFVIEKRKFSQEYWKIAIEKRLEVYEELEHVLIHFQSSNFVDGKPCHLGLLDLESFNSIQTKLAMLSWKRNWISVSVYTKIIQLNRLLVECNLAVTDEEVNDFGVKYYKDVAAIRDEILKLTSKDYLHMDNVKGFFRSKI